MQKSALLFIYFMLVFFMYHPHATLAVITKFEFSLTNIANKKFKHFFK